MTELNAALTDIVSNKSDVSDFVLTPPPAETNNPPPAENEQPEKRGRGRPKGSSTKKPERNKSRISTAATDDAPAAAEIGEIQPEINIEAENRKNAALGATNLIQTSGMLIAGRDGKMSPEEFETVEDGFNRYFEAKGISDFPPGIALGLALGAYYVRTLTTEKAAPKVFGFFFWIKSKFSALKKDNPASAQ